MTDDEGLRAELIQVAAVACAMVEQLDFGAANVEALATPPGSKDGDLGHGMQQGHAVLLDVHEERIRQAVKWGEPRAHTADTWLAILVEEAGEVAEALLESRQLTRHTMVHLVAPRLARIGQASRTYLEQRAAGELLPSDE